MGHEKTEGIPHMFAGFEDGNFNIVVFQSSDHVWNVKLSDPEKKGAN